MAISKTQKKIYDFLRQKAIEGVPPSVREICAAVGLSSTSSVQAGLDALEREGYITRDPMHKRSIRINGIAENVNHVPVNRCSRLKTLWSIFPTTGPPPLLPICLRSKSRGKV